jgi:hypothetical protein
MDTGWTLIAVGVGGIIAIIGSLAVATIQIRAAAKQRRRGWRQKAYVNVLAALNRERQVIALSWPIMTPSQPAPPRLPDEVVEAAEANLMAHSSKRMRRLYNRWVAHRREYYSAGAEA